MNILSACDRQAILTASLYVEMCSRCGDTLINQQERPKGISRICLSPLKLVLRLPEVFSSVVCYHLKKKRKMTFIGHLSFSKFK